jgi:hypothetical protein
MKKDIKFAMSAFLALLVLVPASTGFGVGGAIFIADVSPGQELSHVISIWTKENTTPKNFTAEVYGYARTIDGVNIEVPPENDTGSFTARPFLSIEPKSFSMGPGERTFLYLNGTVPEDVGDGGRYAIVAISTVPDASVGVSVSTAIEVPVLLTIQNGNLIRTGNITALQASQSDEGVAVDMILQNTGNVHYKPIAEAVLMDETSSKVLAKAEIDLNNSNTILPMDSYLFKMKLIPEGGFSPGKYTVEGKVTLEDGTVLDSKETEFEI